MGKQYFLEKFDCFPEVAYNVDTFGHAASLPRLMHKAGQRYYVMMRPQENEMALPARLFRWRGYENGPEVTVFRIARSYNSRQPDLDHVRAALTQLPEGVNHTMCFFGAGDHGGGATQQIIDWIRDNASTLQGARLVFSTPQRFFKAVADEQGLLPLVTGELQHHAIGCYTVHREVKSQLRHAEHAARQAEWVLADDATGCTAEESDRLSQSWRDICFHHFHDTLGGTCLPSAYPAVHAQLGRALANADEIIQYGLRRKMSCELPDDPRARIIFFNPSARAFDDFVEVEPWMEWWTWQDHWRLLDEKNHDVPYQAIEPESGGRIWQQRLCLRVAAAPGQLRVLHIDTREKQTGVAPECAVQSTAVTAENDCGINLHFNARHAAVLGANGIELSPELHLLPDLSDTWSHGMDYYAEGPVREPQWAPPTLQEKGPLLLSFIQNGWIDRTKLTAEYRICSGMPWIELRLRVHWNQTHELLKLVVPAPSDIVEREDGIPGDVLKRPNDRKERPVRDFTLLHLRDGKAVGVVCPDVYALDATCMRLRCTLLRSPVMAHHDGWRPERSAAVHSDQGTHEFRFRFVLGGTGLIAEQLEHWATQMQEPLVAADLTRGMPTWPDV